MIKKQTAEGVLDQMIHHYKEAFGDPNKPVFFRIVIGLARVATNHTHFNEAH